jgi:hypothetical protein
MNKYVGPKGIFNTKEVYYIEFGYEKLTRRDIPVYGDIVTVFEPIEFHEFSFDNEKELDNFYNEVIKQQTVCLKIQQTLNKMVDDINEPTN